MSRVDKTFWSSMPLVGLGAGEIVEKCASEKVLEPLTTDFEKIQMGVGSDLHLKRRMKF